MPAGSGSPDPAEISPEQTAEDIDTTRTLVDWDGLPEAVRLRLAEIAATAVAHIAAADLPAAVRPIARFTPAKRARLGGPALLAGLRDFPVFRLVVREWARSSTPELLNTADPDRATAAAAAVLLETDDAAQRVAEVVRRSSDAQLRAERDAALARVDRLVAENERLHRELEAATQAAQRAGAAGETEADRLRGRLREQGMRLRQALDRVDEVVASRDAELDETRQALSEVQAQRDRERERADAANRRAERASAEAQAARQAVREARAADEVRLRLLVDTVAGAVAGLRRELALSDRDTSDGHRPADLVSGGGPLNAVAGQVPDPAALDRLLALPEAHLVVDGYNVTKTGYPDLTLSDQRIRLTGRLSALAARLNIEITVVFDGAAVVAVPAIAARGIRVLFSDPGVLADDVIRDLVAAEPEGRPVIVVTSDRAVADSVRRHRAYPVPSAVLLSRLSGN